MELKEALGQTLRDLRERNKMAQDNLGPQAYISRVESGTYDPTLKNIEKIAANLGMQPLELLARAISLQEGVSPVDLLRGLAREISKRKGEPPAPPKELISPPL